MGNAAGIYAQPLISTDARGVERQLLMVARIVGIVFCGALGGCAIEPQFAFNSANQDAIFGASSFRDLADVYYRRVPGDPMEARNAIIRRLMLLDDEYFQKYCASFYSGRALADTATDVILSSLTAAATGLTPGTATRVLTGIATAVTATKISVDKNFFLQQSAPAIIAKMEAQRVIVDTYIQQFLQKDVSQYPLEEGLRDFIKYYKAGTLASGVSALAANAVVEREGATQALQQMKLRPSNLTVIVAPRHGVILQKVEPPGVATPQPEATPQPGATPTGGRPAGGGNANESGTVKIPAEFQQRNDNLRWAFTSLTEGDAEKILKGKQFPLPGKARDLLAKNILADASLPLLPQITPVESLAYYRRHAVDDQSLKRLETAYQNNLPNFKP
jgi:hypothetical protein